MDDHKAKEVSGFLNGWIATSVHGSGDEPGGGIATVQGLATQCLAMAAAQDISRADLEAAVGNLEAHIRKAQTIAQRASEAPQKTHPSRT